MRRRVLILLLVLTCCYVLLTLMLWLVQERMIFPGALYGARPVDTVGVRTFELQGEAGPFRVAERVPPDPAAVMVFFVGNGEDLSSAAARVAVFAGHGVAVVSPEYPGYGASAGVPGVESILAVARQTTAYAAGLAGELGVPLIGGGISLGTFSAVHVASRGLVERVFLAAPPTSMLDVASGRFRWLPVALFLRHRFDNLSPAPEVRCPVLILHGDADRIVPIELGERLLGAFGGDKELLRVPGAGHNDLPLGTAGEFGARVGAFLRGR